LAEVPIGRRGGGLSSEVVREGLVALRTEEEADALCLAVDDRGPERQAATQEPVEHLQSEALFHAHHVEEAAGCQQAGCSRVVRPRRQPLDAPPGHPLYVVSPSVGLRCGPGAAVRPDSWASP